MKRKNVAVLGLGITGKAVAEFLAADMNLFLFDERISPRETLKKYPGAKWLHERDIDGLDFAVKSPGIPPSNGVIRTLTKRNVPIYSDLELFYRLYQPMMISVTGTNGKTTVTTAIEYLLRDEVPLHTAGNIGSGVFGIKDFKKEDVLLLECSSFQLHDTETFHPKVGVITNITTDHLDWHETLSDYRRSKLKMIQNMKGDDVLILNIDDPFSWEMKRPDCIVEEVSMGQKVRRGMEVIDGSLIRNIEGSRRVIGKTKDFLIPGDHNIMNLAQSILAVEPFGISPEDAMEKLKNFSGVPHRLEYVTGIKGITFYNDSKGTNPDSTDVAIKAMGNRVILIGGGYDKKADYLPMFEKQKKRIKSLILMGETAEDMKKAAEKAGITRINKVKDMEEAVAVAFKVGEPGDKVLLSPACASWGMYKNYEERGNHFIEIVRELEDEVGETEG